MTLNMRHIDGTGLLRGQYTFAYLVGGEEGMYDQFLHVKNHGLRTIRRRREINNTHSARYASIFRFPNTIGEAAFVWYYRWEESPNATV